MTGNTLEQRARYLLAAEYKSFGFTRGAEALLAGRSDTFDQCALNAVEAALRLSAGADWPEARTLADWHEDRGPVTWWKFPVDEPAWIGSPGDSDWPGYHTHWTPHPAIPAAPRHEPGEGSNG